MACPGYRARVGRHGYRPLSWHRIITAARLLIMQIQEIRIELKNYRCFPGERPVRIDLQPGFVSFVGMNNSGKSTILRFFYEFRQAFGQFASPTGDFLAALVGSARGFQLQGVPDPAEVFSDRNDRDIVVEISVTADEAPADALYPNKLVLTYGRQNRGFTIGAYAPDELPQVDLRWEGQVLWGPQAAGPGVGARADFGPYFKAFDLLHRAIYIGPFRNAINIGATEQYYDLNVGQAFITAWRRFKTGTSRSERAAAIEVTDAIGRIFEFEDLEINASDDGQTLIVNVDNGTYRLQDLGAGIAHFIIVLAYVATRKPSIILIDEPESNLHPALQLDFLTTLGDFSEFCVAFATHSMGLARAASERVYSVQRVQQGESSVSEYERTPDLAEFLGALNFSGYQELGFERVLLVEGTSDVTALQRMLRPFGVEHRIVMIPLGGSSLINAKAEPHLAELKRITPNLSVLIDSERQAKDDPIVKERRAFVDACAKLEIECHVLDRRSLENYFSDSAIKAVMGAKYRELQPYEALSQADPAWAKPDNWRIAGEMTREEIEAAGDLGEFLLALSKEDA